MKSFPWLQILTVMFIGLKLGGAITWSWFWVLSPTLIPLIIVVILFIFIFAVVGGNLKEFGKVFK